MEEGWSGCIATLADNETRTHAERKVYLYRKAVRGSEVAFCFRVTSQRLDTAPSQNGPDIRVIQNGEPALTSALLRYDRHLLEGSMDVRSTCLSPHQPVSTFSQSGPGNRPLVSSCGLGRLYESRILDTSMRQCVGESYTQRRVQVPPTSRLPLPTHGSGHGTSSC